MGTRGLVMACALWLAAGAAQAQSRFSFDAAPGSLPKDVVPSEYRLAVELDPARDRFDGTVEIAVRVRRPVEAIVLNAHQLTAREASLEGAASPRVLDVRADEAKRQWRLADGRAIEPGDYRLRIAYSGLVNAYAEGLYRIVYNAAGKPARMIATQLEAIAARKVFPGFDEPSFRARFAISVDAPAGYEVVSNMPVRSREPHGLATRWNFETTPPMASYLVTLTVGEFDALEDSVEGIPLRILSAKGKKEEARYAMQVTKQVLPFYREYFGIPFMLPKLDQLAIPGVRGGAMEDWGAISYSESLLLFDPARSAARTRQSIFQVMAHEIAHQWFGDLVTAASWDEIWLNEAFATWMEHKASERFNPDWRTRLNHVLWQQSVMREDAEATTRAIRSGPVTESSVFDVFDGVTYVKGGAVLDMLETYLGPEVFRAGLKAYFEDRKLSNATAGDLWYHLAQASGKDIAAIARSWTDQEGYPLLDARFACAGGARTLALEQRRFGSEGPIEAQTLWKVPLEVGGAARPAPRVLLADRKGEFAVGPCSRAIPYIDSTVGFYRVRYDAGHYRALARAFPSLPASERMALLVDTLAMAQAGTVPLADYLALAAHVRPAGDTASQVLFLELADAFGQLDDALAGTPAQSPLRAAARKALAPMLARLGWNASAAEGLVALNLRNSLIRILGRFHDAPTLRKSAELFAAERKGGRIDPTIRPGVMANVARTADRETFDELVRRLGAADRVEDRNMYASAIGNVEDPELARRVLALSLEDALPPETAASLPRSVALGGAHGDLAYAFTRDHYEALARKETEWGRAYLLPNASRAFNDAARAAELLADQKRLAGAAGDKTANEAAGEIVVRSRIKARNGAALGS